MRIAKNKTQLITEAPTSRFMLVIDAMDGDVILQKAGCELISIALDANETVSVRLLTPEGIILLKGKNARHKEVILTASYARFGLYVGGLLTDEEFFLSPIDYKDSEIIAGSYMHFEAGYEYHSMAESGVVENAAKSFDGFRPPFGNDMTLLSPVPVRIGERMHVFYRDERRGGKAKTGMGANRVCALFTENGSDLHSAPIALPIDSVEEKKMCSFSPICVAGRTYLYYVVDYRSSRALSCAVSEDGFSFVKTGLDVEIQGVENSNVSSVCLSADGDDVYLYYGGWGHLVLCRMSEDMKSYTDPQEITPADYVEAPYVMKERGKYLLMYSSGNWMDGSYRVLCACATTPQGPFLDASEVLGTSEIACGAGHNSAFCFKGKHYIAYHRRLHEDKDPHHRILCVDEMHIESEKILPITMT